MNVIASDSQPADAGRWLAMLLYEGQMARSACVMADPPLYAIVTERSAENEQRRTSEHTLNSEPAPKGGQRAQDDTGDFAAHQNHARIIREMMGKYEK